MMNPSNIPSGHLTLAGASSSSKTVAAILKQAKESSKEAARGQQQTQAQKKKSKQAVDQAQLSSNILSHINMSKGSPLGCVASPSVTVSPAMSPSSVRGVSPLGKEHGHPVTTKSSSLSRDLSPSLITAQVVKVMAETTATTTAPNLLRSALQGNMPDPMGILSSSKMEGGFATIVTSATGNLLNYNSSNRKSSAGISSLASSTNSISNSHHQSHTFSKILTSIAGAGGYLCQQDIDSMDSMMTTSTIENLLASSDGTIQTVNVSHIPKTLNPNSQSVGSLAAGVSAGVSSSSRTSQRSAMEVAQQIKMEANGQKSSAELAALRPGMQQQLRSQIQSSRSIDAQLAPKQMPLTFAKTQSAALRTSPKAFEHKTLEASMPLLASKLTPSVAPSAAAKSAPSHAKQQPQITGESSTSTMLSSSSAGSSSLSVTSSLSTSPMTWKTAQNVSSGKLSTEPQHHLQQQNLRNLQQQHGVSFTQTKQHHTESAAVNDQYWIQQHAQQQMQGDIPSPTVIQDELQSLLEKPQAFERLIQSANMADDMTMQPSVKESQAQAVSRQFGSHHGYQRNDASSSSHLSSVPTMVGISNQNFRNAWKTHHDHNTSSMAQTISKYRLGESKQTAIDVDIGQLASISGDDVSISIEPPTSMAAAHAPGKEIKLNNRQPSTGHQLSNIYIPTSSTNQSEHTATKPRDSHIYAPVQEIKSSYSFTPHSLTSNPLLAQLPKPSAYPTTSCSSNSLPDTKAHPPPADFAPPPPYPSRLNQQLQLQQQIPSSKTSQMGKPSAENPFTFPTAGVKVHSDPNSHGPLLSSIPHQNSVTISNSNDRNQEVYGNFKETREPLGTLSKSYIDVSKVYGRQREVSQSMMGGTSDVKAEFIEGYHNHVGEQSTGDRKQLLQPFNQRVSNLSCFPVMNSTYRAAYRSHTMAVQRARSGVITNTAKSLDILRQNLQRSINKEISEIIKRYTDKYFQPAIENIRVNNSESFLGEEHINYVCRQILEEAKTVYMSDSGGRSVTPSDILDSVSETGSLGGRRTFLKRSRVSDSDSEKGSDGGFRRKVAKKKGRPVYQGSGRVTPSKTYKSGDPIKREGPKWDPERLKPETLFVMGARANKALGLGNTRGRLYIRHPDVFKYIGDQEDKLWLCEHNLMPATGGKAYMLLLEDIEDLSRSDDYKDSQGLMMHECIGFTVPEWMLVKMKEQMRALRSDCNKRSLSRSPASEFEEPTCPKILPFSAFTNSRVKEEIIVSPADTEEMDFLSTADNDDLQPTSGISPFTVSVAFEDAASPSPSDLDRMEDPPTVPSLFS